MDTNNQKQINNITDINASQRQRPFPYGSMLDIPATKYSLLTTQEQPYKRTYFSTKNTGEFSGEKNKASRVDH